MSRSTPAVSPQTPSQRDGTIPKDGLSANFWHYVQRVTGSRSLARFIWQGTVLTLLSPLPTIGAAVLRGVAYRAVLGGIGSACLIEEDVRFHVPRRIFLGKRVFIGQYAYLDAGCVDSFIRLGNNAHVAQFAVLRAGERGITVHDNVGINARSFLDGNGGIEIGPNTLLSPGVQCISGNHVVDDRETPIRQQGTAYGKVTIGEDCWLGTNVVVLPGVTIGRGAVIGAGAVVTRDVPAFAIALGVPADVIGERGKKPPETA